MVCTLCFGIRPALLPVNCTQRHTHTHTHTHIFFSGCRSFLFNGLLCFAHCRCGFSPDVAAMWELDWSRDSALVLLIDSISRKLSVPSGNLKAHDISITEAELATSSLQPLQGE